MSDKDVQRNVRSSGKEGVQTPTEKHYHSIGAKSSFPVGQTRQSQIDKEKLLAKFHTREQKLKKKKEKIS